MDFESCAMKLVIWTVVGAMAVVGIVVLAAVLQRPSLPANPPEIETPPAVQEIETPAHWPQYGCGYFYG